MQPQLKRGPNYISNMRRNRNLLQKQLAVLLGVKSERCISHYENGTAFPPFLSAVLLEIILGARLSELYPELYRECQQLVIVRARASNSNAYRAIVERLLQEGLPDEHPRSG
jgi:transcriptional regulator with XRE-family HTH domain